jgi:hypothetical protein
MMKKVLAEVRIVARNVSRQIGDRIDDEPVEIRRSAVLALLIPLTQKTAVVNN